MKPETKALQFIENVDDNLQTAIKTLEKIKFYLEENAHKLEETIEKIRDETGGVIASKEILNEMLKTK
tara:strand:- start:7591 stop:7794 length:204 start_codon:yes stop_codon:yes gene_type:complete